jgi:hypothetical protein
MLQQSVQRSFEFSQVRIIELFDSLLQHAHHPARSGADNSAASRRDKQMHRPLIVTNTAALDPALLRQGAQQMADRRSLHAQRASKAGRPDARIRRNDSQRPMCLHGGACALLQLPVKRARAIDQRAGQEQCRVLAFFARTGTWRPICVSHGSLDSREANKRAANRCSPPRAGKCQVDVD